MRYYWLQDRHFQKQTLVFWETKHTNLEDYFTKRNSETRHVQIRPFLISDCNDKPRNLDLTDLTKQPDQFVPETRLTSIPIKVTTGKSTGQPPG